MAPHKAPSCAIRRNDVQRAVRVSEGVQLSSHGLRQPGAAKGQAANLRRPALPLQEMTVPFRPKRVLVTGARGFLGRAVVRAARRGFSDADIDTLGGRRDQDGGDLMLPDTWRRLNGGYDLVFHLAAAIPREISGPDDKTAYAINVAMAERLLEACEHWQPAKIVYASSISVYPPGAASVLHEDLVPNTKSRYGVSKLIGEHLLAMADDLGTDVVRLRMSSLYGPGQFPGTVLPMFLGRALSGEPITIFDGGARTQDFLYVTDAAEGFIQAAKRAQSGVYNLGSGDPVSMRALAQAIKAQPGLESTSICSLDRADPEPSVRLDTSRAAREFGFKPRIALSEGLACCLAATHKKGYGEAIP